MSIKSKGMTAVIISAVLFGLTPFFMKTVYEGGATNFTCAFYRFLIPLFPQLVYLKLKGIDLKISIGELKTIAIMSVFGYGGTAVLLFSSYNYLPSGMCTTIHFVYPVFVIIGNMLFFKQKINPVKILCVALSTLGIIMFYDGQGGSNLLGIIIAFASGMTYAFYIIMLDKSGLQKMDTIKLIFYLNLVAAIVIFIICMINGESAFVLTPVAWFTLVIAAISLTFIAVVGFQLGVKYIGSESAAILSTFEPITSVVMGIIVYHEAFSLKTAVGCIAILTAVIIIAKMKEK